MLQMGFWRLYVFGGGRKGSSRMMLILLQVIIQSIASTLLSPGTASRWVFHVIDRPSAKGDAKEFLKRRFRPHRLGEIPLCLKNAVVAGTHVGGELGPRRLGSHRRVSGGLMPGVRPASVISECKRPEEYRTSGGNRGRQQHDLDAGDQHFPHLGHDQICLAIFPIDVT